MDNENINNENIEEADFEVSMKELLDLIMKLKHKQKEPKIKSIRKRHKIFNYRYRCNVCNKAYCQKTAYKRHMNKHDSDNYHDDYKDKYMCVNCLKEFATQSGLNGHQRFKHGHKTDTILL
jgi:uncharacterized Zn-finger protein